MSVNLIKEHFVSESSYIVFQSDDGLYYAVNQKTKAILAKSGSAAEAIQQAVNALSGEGGRIHIKSGEYVIDTPITVTKSHLIIEGNGWDTVIRYEGSDAAFKIGDGTSPVNNVIIRNLRLIGGNAGNTAILLYDAHFCLLENIRIEEFVGSAVKLDRSWINTIRNCDIRHGSIGIELDGVSDNQPNDITIHKTYLGGASQREIEIKGADPQNITVDNCVIADAPTGIYIIEGENINITRNYFENITGYNIHVGAESYTVENVKIFNNWFVLYSTSARGVYINQAKRVTIAWNTVRVAFATPPEGIFVETTANTQEVYDMLNDCIGAASSFEDGTLKLKIGTGGRIEPYQIKMMHDFDANGHLIMNAFRIQDVQDGIGVTVSGNPINFYDWGAGEWMAQFSKNAITQLPHLKPRSSETFDLGDETLKWNKVYAKNVDADVVKAASNLQVNTSSTSAVAVINGNVWLISDSDSNALQLLSSGTPHRRGIVVPADPNGRIIVYVHSWQNSPRFEVRNALDDAMLFAADVYNKVVEISGDLNVSGKIYGTVGSLELLPKRLSGLNDLKKVEFREDGIPIARTLPTFEESNHPEGQVNINHTIAWIIQCLRHLTEKIEEMEAKIHAES